MTDNNLSNALVDALKANRLSELLGADGIQKLCRLAELVTDFNSHTNITAVKDPRGLILSHFCDSLTVAPMIPKGARVADVGCGGGFPTLPLAIARPDITVTAIDSTQKKLDFVRTAAEELGLGGVTTLCVRAEELAHGDARESFDFVTARAVSALPVLCELCLPLTALGGVFCAMKGPRGEEELIAAEKATAVLGGRVESKSKLTLRAPDSDEALDRTLITIRKVAKTPAAYPRAYGRIKNKPL